MKTRALALLLVAALAPLASSCSSKCAEIQSDWESWKSGTSPFVADSGQSDDIHLGVALRVATLNKLLDSALEQQMNDALEFSDKLRVATGNSLAVRADGKVLDLGLFPDKACENCLRVEGKLDGKLAVKIPVLGEQGVPLRGTFQLIGPVDFGSTDEGEATVVLDLAKVADVGKSRVSAEIAELPPTWTDALETPLSRRILKAVGERLGPVTLFTFEPLGLDVEGLEVRPVKIATDPSNGVIFAGFTTNLSGPSTGLAPLLDLDANENAAFTVEPGIIGSAITAMQRSGKVPELYDEDGKASKTGPFRASVQSVAATAEEDGALGYQTQFRIWNLGEDESCYWANADANGTATIEDDEVVLGLRNVELTDSSMNGVKMAIANWAFLGRVDKVLDSSLSAKTLEVPGSKLVLQASRLRRHGSGLAVAGKLVDAQ